MSDSCDIAIAIIRIVKGQGGLFGIADNVTSMIAVDKVTAVAVFIGPIVVAIGNLDKASDDSLSAQTVKSIICTTGPD